MTHKYPGSYSPIYHQPLLNSQLALHQTYTMEKPCSINRLRKCVLRSCCSVSENKFVCYENDPSQRPSSKQHVSVMLAR